MSSSQTPPTTGQELAAAPVQPGFAKASSELSLALGLTPRMMGDVLRAQCFRNVKPDQVTDEQLAAFIVIANEMKVNPLLPGMMYAYPNPQGGGITPMMGPDAVFKKLQEHAEVDAWQCDVFPEDVTKPPTHATMKIWRKGKPDDKPLVKTCLFAEWKVGTNPNWNSRPRHMMELRTIKQGARMIIHGIPFDEDERQIMGEINVTPGAEGADPAAAGAAAAGKRAKAPPKDLKGAAAVSETKTEAAPEAGKSNGKPMGQVIEGEFTETKRAENATTAQSGTTAPESGTTPAKTETAPPKTETVAAPPPEEKKIRAFLQDGEQIDATVTVKTVTPMFVTAAGVRTPSIQAKVEGDFTGTVLHIGGGAAKGDGIVPLPMWEPGKAVKATLLGKLNKTSGQVMVRVEKAEEAAAEMSVD